MKKNIKFVYALLIITIFASGLVFVIQNRIDKNQQLLNITNNLISVIKKPTKNNDEILQSATTDDYYFKVVVTQNEDDYYPKVKAIKVFDKKTNRLTQTMKVDCDFRMGSEDIKIGDYNFDGIKDFSIFDQQYAGAATSDLYFAYDPKIKQFVNMVSDEIGGVDVEFDPIKKEVETSNHDNSYASNSTYKVVNNKFILVKEDDTEWTDEGDLKSEVTKEYDLKGNLIKETKK